MRTASTRFLPCLVLAVAALSAAAAPIGVEAPAAGDTAVVGSPDGGVQPGSRGAVSNDGAGGRLPGAAAAGGSGSDTIELLLDLNARTPAGNGDGAAQPAQPRLSPEAARIAAKALGLPPPGSGGSELQAPSAAPKPGDPEWVPTKPLAISNPFGSGPFDASGAERRGQLGMDLPRSATGDEDDVRWLLPPALVRFVKQNRELVIGGSVALLILLWVATAFGGRRR